MIETKKCNILYCKLIFCVIFATLRKTHKTTMTALQKLFQYYLDHQEELVKKYNGKFVVIKDEEVVGAYESELDAYQDSVKKFELGTFLIQQCSPGEESYTQTFRTRVIF